MCSKRNNFCLICGLFVDKRHKIDVSVNKHIILLYEEYFSRPLEQRKWYIPSACCSSCYATLRSWKNCPDGSFVLPFLEPVNWLPLRVHRPNNCYFCLTKTRGYYFKIRQHMKYANVDSVIKTVSHQKNYVVPERISPDLTEFKSSPSHVVSPQSEYAPSEREFKSQHFMSQGEFHDLVRDLELSKRQTELLGSRLKQWNYLQENVNITFHRTEETSLFGSLFNEINETNDLAYCNDVNKLFEQLGYSHVPQDWRLFIDGSTKSLKAVLLHNDGSLPSVPLAYATNIKETYDSVSLILNAIGYTTHKWLIVADLKVLTIFNGLQGGNTKYPCYFCEWDSRDSSKHYIQRDWKPRTTAIIGEKNSINIPLVNPTDIILPPLHIKLGLIKQFVKALDKNGPAFKYLEQIFPRITSGKLKEGIFIGPQIRKLAKDDNFIQQMNLEVKIMSR